MTSRDKRLDLHHYAAHSRRIESIEARIRELWAAAYESFKRDRP